MACRQFQALAAAAARQIFSPCRTVTPWRSEKPACLPRKLPFNALLLPCPEDADLSPVWLPGRTGVVKKSSLVEAGLAVFLACNLHSQRIKNFQWGMVMKAIVAVLVESPLYFSLPVWDRYHLVRRLRDREKGMDLSSMHSKLNEFLQVKAQPD